MGLIVIVLVTVISDALGQKITHELPRINPFKQHSQPYLHHNPHPHPYPQYSGYVSPLRPGYRWPVVAPAHHLPPTQPSPTLIKPIKYVTKINYPESSVSRKNATFSLEEGVNLKEHVDRPIREDISSSTTSTVTTSTTTTTTIITTTSIEQSKSNISKEISDDDDTEERYNFGYAVKDDKHGDDFSHQVSNDGVKSNGEYRVALPDGRVQVLYHLSLI